MNEDFNYCHVVGKTDVGRKRAANEDNMYNTITQNGLVSVVCDGMGGHVGGATASKIAVSTIVDNLNKVYYDDPRIAIGESIDRANQAIINKTIEQPELQGMGSTCVLLLVRNGKVYIGHVGDSRIYLIRSKRIVQLTKDHSYVQMLVDCGEITKEQAEHHPRKNEITNALGIPNMSPATVADDAIVPEAGDCFVLCSDGLSGMVSDDTICKVISRQSEMNAQDRVDKLVALANENGGVDNITVQLVEFSVAPNVITPKHKFPLWAKIMGAISIFAIVGIGGYFISRKQPEVKMDNNKQEIANEKITKNDTMSWRCPEIIPFQRNASLIELEYAESSLMLKHDSKPIYVFRSSFDQNSLSVCTNNIKVQYNNSLLVFTDKYPGDSVVLYITQSDKLQTLRCVIDISNTNNHSSFTIPSNTTPKKIGEEKDEEPNNDGNGETEQRVDTITLEFEYHGMVKESRLLFNYSAKPKLIFNKEEHSIEKFMVGQILKDDLAFNDLYWKTDLKDKHKQLLFIFRGEHTEDIHSFVIPCIIKDSKDKILIFVKLVPHKNEDNKSPLVVDTQNEDTINQKNSNND